MDDIEKVRPTLSSHDDHDVASISSDQDVELFFMQFVNFLHSCLTVSNILELAKELYVSSENLSSEAIEKLKVVAKIGSKDELFSLFTEYFKKEAKQCWKVDFLNALQELELTFVYNIINSFIKTSNSQLAWLLANWNTLEARNDLHKIVSNLDLKKSKIDSHKHLLLRVVHQTLEAGEDTFTKLVAALRNVEETSEQIGISMDEQRMPKENVNFLLNVIVPLLKSQLSNRQFINLFKELTVNNYFSKDHFNEFKSLPSVQRNENTAETFLTYFTKNVKENWKESLLLAFSERGLTDLKEVVQYYFEKPEIISWFLNNWYVLQNTKTILMTAARNLALDITVNEGDDSWLLSYLQQVLRQGENALREVTAILDDNGKVRIEIMQAKVELDNKDLLSDLGGSPNGISADVADSLQPLASILKYCIDSKQLLLDIAKNLLIDKHFRNDSLDKLKRSVETEYNSNNAITLFFSLLEKDAQSDWKIVFVDALEAEDLKALHFIIRNYFYNSENKFVKWIVQTWEELVKMKEELLQIAHEIGVCGDVTPNKEMSVLLVMFEALQFDDEMRETFFTKVQNTILQSEKAEIPQLSKELIGEDDAPSEHTLTDVEDMDFQVGDDIEKMEVDDYRASGELLEISSKVIVEQPLRRTFSHEVTGSGDQLTNELGSLNTDLPTNKDLYRMEFRAVLEDDCNLSEGGNLMLLICGRGHYPMRRHPRLLIFEYALPMSVSKFEHIYKYFIRNKTGDKWEEVPFCNHVWNRKCCFDKEQIASRHVVVFDAIFFEEKEEHDYVTCYQKNLTRLLPSFDGLEALSMSDVIKLTCNTYKQWGKTFFSKKQFVNESNDLFKQTGPLGSQEILAQHIKLEADRMEANRVTESICLYLMICDQNLSLFVKVSFCLGLRLNLLDDAQYHLFLQQFNALKLYYETSDELSRNTSFDSLLKLKVSCLSNIPQFLLVLPLLKLAENTTTDINNTDTNSPPFVSDWKRLQSKLIKNEKHQRDLVNLSDKVCQLSERFCWMKQAYFEALTLQSVAAVLESAEVLQSAADKNFVNAEILLPKLLQFWQQLNINSSCKDLKEEVLALISYFIVDDLKSTGEEVQLEKDDTSKKSDFLAVCLAICSAIIAEMKEYIKSKNKRHDFLRWGFNTFDEIFKIAQETAEKENINQVLVEVKALKNDLLGVANLLLRDRVTHTNEFLNIESWNCIAEMEWSDESFRKNWRDNAQMVVVEVTRRVFKDPMRLIDYYCGEFENAKPHKLTSEWLTEIVIDQFVKFVIAQQKEKGAVKKEWKKIQKKFAKKTNDKFFQSKVITVSANVLMKQWKNRPKYEGTDRLKFLEFAQNWNILFLETTIENKLVADLPQNVKKEIASIEENFLLVLQELQSGQIVVGCLQKLSEMKEAFYDCLHVIQASIPPEKVVKPLPRERFYQLISLRLKELAKYEETVHALRNLVNFFTSVAEGKVNLRCEEVERVLAQYIPNLRLASLITCRPYEKKGRLGNANGSQVKNFPLSDDDLLLVVELQRNKVLPYNSRVIRKRLTNTIESTLLKDLDQINLHQALKFLWKPLRQEANSIVKMLDDETISLMHVDDVFFSFDSTVEIDRNILREELGYLYGVAADVNAKQKRKAVHLQLIEKYLNLKNTWHCAELLWQTKELLNLGGSFTKLKTVLNLKNEAARFSLSTMNQLCEEVIKILRLPIAETYHMQTLKKFIGAAKLILWLKENVKESKAVKTMIDLAMVAAGEVPMEVDRVSCLSSAVMGFSPLVFDLQPNSDFEELLKACEKVWENVANDRTVLNKWEEAGKQLGWLDYVQSFHGSVEKSSLEKTQLINSNGLYVIKCGKDEMPTIENSIQLIILEKDSEKTMSVSELRELQSKLMLITGGQAKGKEDVNKDVNKFIEILSSVENLTKTFVNLKRFGCSLFMDWSARVWCGNEGTNHVTVEVRFSENSEAIPSSYNVIKELHNLTTILDETYSQWINFLTKNRNKHYHLNHFNVLQLTYLCKELASSGDYNKQVYQLLASVLPDVNEDVITKCLKEATEMVVEEQEQDDEEYQETESDVPGITEILNKAKDFTLKQVINQLQMCIVSDKTTLSYIIKIICRVYFKGAVLTSHEDCLSLEICGNFLTGLAKHCNQLHDREWSGHFTDGKPNLLICRQPKDVLLVLLSLYMQSPDQGLPSSSEVLLCSEDTSAEDVELLFRRAVGLQADTGKRIYCLARADLLPFNVSKQVEECFESLMQLTDRNANFRLVILTCSEQHYLTACFYEHKVGGFTPAKKKDLKTFIKRNLSNENVVAPATQVHENGSSVIVVGSALSGMGKSLYISRCREKALMLGASSSSSIRLLEKSVNVDDVVMTLIERSSHDDAHFVHIDITPSVQAGKSKLLFELVILGKIQNSRGVVWRHLPCHLYMLEYTKAIEQVDVSFSKFLNLLPSVKCLSPIEVRDALQRNPNQAKVDENLIYMDTVLLKSEMYQRPYQYLRLYGANANMDSFTYRAPIENSFECLDVLLRFCSVESPSWSELSHFSKFLNTQLQDCEMSDFCNINAVGDEFQGFKHFVVRFMIKMSQDFAIPSLQESNASVRPVQVQVQKPNREDWVHEKFNDFLQLSFQTIMFILHWAAFLFRKTFGLSVIDDDDADDPDEDDQMNVNLLALHQLQRRWENSIHPYVFFNADRHSMSFANFNVNEQGSLCHPKTKNEIERDLMRPQLVLALTRNGVNLQQELDNMIREKKLAVLCQVFGVEEVIDPDQTYELTTDNVLKMLAIQMRFRCGIPVVMMGETGCGKTRMIEFMSRLKAGGNPDVQNMVVVKVHGGVTASMVQEKVEKAIILARQNSGQNLTETILFLDEANTTEAIYAIKEIMCDETVRGVSFADSGLRIVAACNPYRAHPPDVIEAMEKSGLGFHVRPEDVSDTFDDIPMRHLVYRVIALPPSMRPLVWDFGQLSNATEEVYINQMVNRLQKEINSSTNVLHLSDDNVQSITRMVTASQAYMRGRYDICNFVSLRDAERTMQTFRWFYVELRVLNPLIEAQKERSGSERFRITDCVRALIQALSVCYYVTLTKRKSYRSMLAKEIMKWGSQRITEQMILAEIIACQNVFINAIELERNIACNEALRENVFMMVICAELRIPLFLVGKPGSSKSLAKTIVTDAMQGRSSKSELYRNLKEIHVLSFQCSAVTDAIGIEAVFAQCAQLQKKKDCRKYVAMVVLDEIGLAEDSKKMPLKVLHPLLETASTTSTSNVEPHQKVGFVGISNWALDPAKMNRGLFVTRGKPSNHDLHKTAEAIFESDQTKLLNARPCIRAVTEAYLEIYEGQGREFFGLRDYYAMMKMLYAACSDSDTEAITFDEVGRAVIRNFSGLSNQVLQVFQKHCKDIFDNVELPKIPVMELIRSNLNPKVECRFLMILAEQYSAVNLLPEILGYRDYVVIFGSSFPHDHDYTEVCRNINKIKVCMETGRTVVLLNLKDLYESLYDALNQHYVTLAGQRYVDLGLGGHRVKCRIASNFKLIVIEKKEIVYEDYEIPLINRLEKHVFEMRNVLTESENVVVDQLKSWIESCCKVESMYCLRQEFTEQNTFLGSNDDSCASALLTSQDKSFESAQKIMLQTATLDGICRLPQSEAQDNADKLLDIYMKEQIHESLSTFLQKELEREKISIHEIISFSQVLNEKDRLTLQKILNLEPKNLLLLTLQQFQTEQQYSERIDEFLDNVYAHGHDFVLLVQCSQAHQNGSLIACAKYATSNIIEKNKQKRGVFSGSLTICFILTLERRITITSNSLSYVNFYSGNCSSMYIDELKPNFKAIASVSKLWDFTINDIFLNAVDDKEMGLVDLKQLIRESIPIAMAKLQNRVENFSSKIQLLLSLCFENSASFFSVILKKIQLLLEDRERRLSARDEWIIEQACSAAALQEGGTFTNVLWLKLKNIVAIALAKIISVADADGNLDLLKKSIQHCPKFADLWLQVFDRTNLWNLQWTNIANDGESLFVVEGVVGFSCHFPFARFVYDIIMKEWLLLKETNIQDHREVFLQKMESSAISWLFDAAEDIGVRAVKSFSHDLVHIMYKPKSPAEYRDAEFDAVQNYLLNAYQIQRKKQQRFSNALLEVFVMLIENQKNFKLFAEVVEILPAIVVEAQRWTNMVQDNGFNLHQKAFQSVILQLYNSTVVSFDSVEVCKAWMSRIAKVSFLCEKLLSCSDKAIQQKWRHLLFVHLFLEELLPVSKHPNDNIDNRYLQFLSGYAHHLWSQAVNYKNLSDLPFLKNVVKILKSCTEELRLRLLCDWNDISCIVCKEDMLKEPVMLPCCRSHVCHACATNQRAFTCRYCERQLNDTDSLQPQNLTDSQQKEFKTFNSACTSFFLEYLSSLCFPTVQDRMKNATVDPPSEDMLMAVEELVVNDNRTKVISPVLAEMDLHPTARSYILQLLLRCDEKLVERQFERHFETMEQVLKDRTALIEIYIKCKQDMLQRVSFASSNSSNLEANSVFAYTILLEAVDSVRNVSSFSQLEHLQTCAMLQFVAKTAAACIMQTTEKSISNGRMHEATTFISAICRLCADPEFLIFRQFIIKCLCRRYGVDSLNVMIVNDSFKKLVPENLLAQTGREKDNYFQADKLSLTGERYLKTKTLLLDIAQESDEQGVTQQIYQGGNNARDDVIQILLAASAWVDNDRTNPLRLETFYNLFRDVPQNLRFSVFNDIAQGRYETLKCTKASINVQYALTQLFYHFAVVVSSCQDELIQSFKQLVEDSNAMILMFLPTMPGVDYSAVREVMMNQVAHSCPNGHPYYIGECGRAWEVAKCPECNVEIGGRRHELAKNNRKGELTEQSQSGYRIRKATASNPERNLSKLSVCATRICLHLAMLLGSRNGDGIARMIKRGRGQEVDFLFGEIQFDLSEISKLIGCSVDDVFMLIHFIFNRMRTSQNSLQSFSWNSMKERETWENEFQQRFLAPVFSHSTDLINQAQNILLNAGKLTEKPLERLIYELKEELPLPNGIVPWNVSNLWKYMLHVDINHLRQTLEAVATTSSSDGAALKVFINSEHLGIIRHLHTLIIVQAAFIKRYGQKIDTVDAENTTVEDFLQKENFIYEMEIDTYMQVWNKVKNYLLNVDRTLFISSCLEDDMTRDSPISMCLPSRRGRGMCALLMAEYLIEKQNNLLLMCRELVESKLSLKAVDVGDLDINDLICINTIEDLMPIVLENSQYETTVTESGLKHNITYNLGLLQKKILHKYVFGKPIINKETIPLMKYPQDMGLANDFQAIQMRDSQNPLPMKICQEVDDSVDNCLTAKLCEAVRTLTLVVQFLAKDTSLSGEKRIFEFAEKELLLPPEETEMIPRSAQISHCLALYERLSWHRSKRLIQNGQNPFANVKNLEDIVNLLLLEKLKQELKKMKLTINRLQLELNSVLMFGPPMENPDWSLVSDVLLPYLEMKYDEDDNSWCEQVPHEIMFKHAAHVFNVAMEYAT